MKKLIEVVRGQPVPDDAKWVKDFQTTRMGAAIIMVDVWEVPHTDGAASGESVEAQEIRNLYKVGQVSPGLCR